MFIRVSMVCVYWVCASVIGVSASAAWAGIEVIGNRLELSEGSSLLGRSDLSLAYNSTDQEYLFAWSDYRNEPTDGTSWDVFGQRVSSSGEVMGSNFQIIQKPGAQADPRVAYNPKSNEFFVSWRSQEGAEQPPRTFNQTRGRIVASDGSLGSESFLGLPALEPTLVYNGTQNEYFLTNRGFFDSPSGIYGQRLTDAGAIADPQFLITNAGAPAPAGAIAYNPMRNEYLVTWRDQVNESLKGRRVSASGQLLDQTITISDQFPATFSGRTSAVAYDPDNDRYLVTFGLFSGTGLFGQFIDGDGSPSGSNFPIASTAPGRPASQLAYDPELDMFVVAWQELRGSFRHVKLQALDPDGSPVGSTLRIDRIGALQHPASLAYNPDDGQFIIGWVRQLTNDRSSQELVAQRFRIVVPEPTAVGVMFLLGIVLLLWHQGRWRQRRGEPVAVAAARR